MAKAQTEALLKECGLGDRRPPDFFRSQSDVRDAPQNGYSHVLRRAWKSFEPLAGVLSVGGRPTVYFQHHADESPLTLAEQHRFWSNGIAPILVRATPREVRVYSALRPPALAGEDVDGNERLVKVFERTADALELRDFIRSVEAATVYDRYAKHFDPTQAVDRKLVENLRAVRTLMSAGPKPRPDLAAIHRLLGRVLFTCYLEARGALVGKDFGRLGAGTTATFEQIISLHKPQAVRNALTRLFQRLAKYFRGNLFGPDLERDLSALRDHDTVTLRNLIRGHELGSGQMVLPFDVYDFSVIPIEIISAIYEDFIRAEDPDAQRKKGAYYTPPKLVEFTTDLATEAEPDMTGKRVLDPGCGSGVFLVSMFNRMGETWVRQNERARNGTRAKALAKILREQICGVDRSLVACQATCFSLYMAMLDFLEPREIQRLEGRGLPELLREDNHEGRDDRPQTVIHGDFLSSPAALESQKFDLIVGNPPWVSRGNVEKASMAKWIARNPEEEFPLPAGQVACAFMWEAARYLKRDGRACLLLPAKIFLGVQTDSFQEKWFSRYCVETVAQLSDLRFFLFPSVAHPTIAVRFGPGVPRGDHRVDYLTPKASHVSLRDNVVTIEPDDRKTLALADILSSANKKEAAAHWLSYNWASPRDREFLLRLRDLSPLGEIVGEAHDNKRWIKGQGFQPHGKDQGRARAFWQPGHRFLDAKRKFDLLITEERDTEPIGSRFPSPHRARDERLFKSPLVVFNKGFSKFAFAPFDVLFRDCYQAISGPETDRTLLTFLTATLISPLARYFLFHLSSDSFYRTSYLNEVLRLPFPLPQAAPGSKAVEAVRAVAKIFARVERDERFGALGHEQLITEAKHDATRHVYSYFDVSPDEEILIEDTVEILQKSATPSRGSRIPTLGVPSKAKRECYAETLIDALHAWGGRSRAGLSATCVVSENAGVAVLTIAKARSTTRYKESKAPTELDHILSRLNALSPERYGSLVYLRNLAVLETDRMHIVKPLTLRYWLRSAALNDADAAATHLLTQGSERAKA